MISIKEGGFMDFLSTLSSTAYFIIKGMESLPGDRTEQQDEEQSVRTRSSPRHHTL
jgi:hypothetical protein